MKQQERLTQIVRCSEALHFCVMHRQMFKPGWHDPMGAEMGELDWLSELHYFLYSVTPEDYLQSIANST